MLGLSTPPVEVKMCWNLFKIIKKIIIDVEISILQFKPEENKYIIEYLYEEKQ